MLRAALVRAVLPLVLGALATSAIAAPASAHSGAPPSGCVLYTVGFGASCFEWDGDDHWVLDGNPPNGWSTRVQIETSYGKVRWCANTHGAGTWHECTFDHTEGACVRWRMFEQNGTGGPTRNWTNWTYWHSTSTGDRC